MMELNNLLTLIIDDDPSWLNLFSRMLKDNGVKHIDTASDEKTAIQAIMGTQYHLIISDTYADDNTTPMGPNSIIHTENYEKKPVIVATSNLKSRAIGAWQEEMYDYFLEKGSFEREEFSNILSETLTRF